MFEYFVAASPKTNKHIQFIHLKRISDRRHCAVHFVKLMMRLKRSPAKCIVKSIQLRLCDDFELTQYEMLSNALATAVHVYFGSGRIHQLVTICTRANRRQCLFCHVSLGEIINSRWDEKRWDEKLHCIFTVDIFDLLTPSFAVNQYCAFFRDRDAAVGDTWTERTSHASIVFALFWNSKPSRGPFSVDAFTYSPRAYWGSHTGTFSERYGEKETIKIDPFTRRMSNFFFGGIFRFFVNLLHIEHSLICD